MPAKKKKVVTKDQRESKQLGAARTVADVIMRGIARGKLKRRFQTMEGLLAVQDRTLYVSFSVHGETVRGAFGRGLATQEIQMFNTYMRGSFIKALIMSLPHKNQRQRLVPRDISILSVAPLLRGNGAFAPSSFIVSCSFNCQKGGCSPQVVEELLQGVVKCVTKDEDQEGGWFRGMAYKLRKLGVETLMTAGKAADFNPVVTMLGKIRLSQPTPAFTVLASLDPISLSRMETVCKSWKVHLSWSSQTLWRRACQTVFVTLSGKPLRFNKAAYEEDGITEGYKRGITLPFRKAYACLYVYTHMCNGRGKYQLKWALNRDGILEPQWTTALWQVMVNAITITQDLCPSFCPPMLESLHTAETAPMMDLGEVLQEQVPHFPQGEKDISDSTSSISESSEDDLDNGDQFQSSLEDTTAYLANLFGSRAELPPLERTSANMSRPSTKSGEKWQVSSRPSTQQSHKPFLAGSRCTTPFLNQASRPGIGSSR